jgi:hypothetical protein
MGSWEHRPGAGSYTPNWGTTGDRDVRDFVGGPTSCVALRPRPDPAKLGLAPAPVTGDGHATCG